ncbi:hypothetical protein PG357_02230 [Riemerella anatipestifer]|nr:hypothetical protein [Riemerella anatipestifer]
MLRYLFALFLLLVGTLKAQTGDVPAFYKEMQKNRPNVFVVDSLYDIYRANTSLDFDAATLEEIKKMKASNPNRAEKSPWLSNARQENSPIKKEFRSEYEKKYLEWRREIQAYINEEGYIDYPSAQERNQTFSQRPKTPFLKRVLRSLGIASGEVSSSIYDSPETPYHATFSGWHYYGPVQLLSNTGQNNVTSQANVRAFAQSPTNPNHTVCAVESGTVYISHNKGKMWHLATKGYDIKEVSALSFSASDEKVIFVGGAHGLYISRDGGVTWTILTNFNTLTRYAGIGNNVSKIISVATDGNAVNDNVLMATNRGIVKLKQTGSGSSVSYQYEVKLPLCVTDIVKRPNSDNEFYAVAYDAATNFMYFYKSTDGGETWVKKGTEGKGWYEPAKKMANVWGARLAITPADDQVVYAYIIANQTSRDNGYWGVYRSNDAGENWTLPNPNGPGAGTRGYNNSNNINLATFPFQPTGSYTQGFYNCAIIASPTNANTIIVGGLNAYISRDGGQTFKYFGGYWGPKSLHADMQTFYQQTNADGSVDTWLTTDGGINYSNDFFETVNEVRTFGLGGDYWGFDLGEYNTNMGGGMYHNGDSYHVSTYGKGVFKHLGGGESSTGYVLPGNDERHFFFSDFSGIIASPEVNTSYSPAYKLDPIPSEPYAGRGLPYYTQRDHNGNMYYFTQTKEEKVLGKFNLQVYNYKDNKVYLLKEMTTSKDTAPQQYMVSFSNPLYQYLIVNNKLYASTDGGKNWEEKTTPFANNMSLAIVDNDPKTIYVLRTYTTGNNVLKVSNDGGTSFQNIDNPNTNRNYKHILNVRGTDVIFLFGNNQSKVHYYIDGTWKEYSEDLPFNLNILEPKIQYRTGEFFMATSGSGIWTRKLPDDVLAKMNVVKINIESPKKTTVVKDFVFEPNNISLYYGKTIVSRQWEFPGAAQVNNAETDKPSVVYNKYGKFGVKLTLTDSEGQNYTQTFPDFFTVYPYCACDAPNVMKELIGNISVWVDADRTNMQNQTVTDRITGEVYSLVNTAGMSLEKTPDLHNGKPVLSFKANNSYIDLGKTYEGKTFFVVSKLNPNANNAFNFLLGDNGSADFHSNGRLGSIFSSAYMSDRQRFNSANNGRTQINGINRNFFNTNFYTDKLSVYAMRVADGKTGARVRYISKDRGFSDRTWRGEVAEVIVFDKSLTDEEMTQVNDYLMTKYALNTEVQDLPSSIPGLIARINADGADLNNKVVLDYAAKSAYDIINPAAFEIKTSGNNNQKIINIKPNYSDAHIQLNTTYEGKTFFVVSKLHADTKSNFSFILGSDATDFHSGGRLGPILSSSFMRDSELFFPLDDGLTMINNQPASYFSTNFNTSQLTLYTLRVANGKPAAKVSKVSKDRNDTKRVWQGEIGEVLIYDRQLSDEEVQQVNTYLMQKFGL